MMVFDSVDELINFLVKDSGLKVPFPTRFINVENLSDFTTLKNDLLCAHRIYFLMYCFENLFYSVECSDVRKKIASCWLSQAVAMIFP